MPARVIGASWIYRHRWRPHRQRHRKTGIVPDAVRRSPASLSLRPSSAMRRSPASNAGAEVCTE